MDLESPISDPGSCAESLWYWLPLSLPERKIALLAGGPPTSPPSSEDKGAGNGEEGQKPQPAQAVGRTEGASGFKTLRHAFCFKAEPVAIKPLDLEYLKRRHLQANGWRFVVVDFGRLLRSTSTRKRQRYLRGLLKSVDTK